MIVLNKNAVVKVSRILTQRVHHETFGECLENSVLNFLVFNMN